MEPSGTGSPKPNRASREVLFHPIRLAPYFVPSPDALSPALILNKLMDVFFAKLPQALSFCRTKFYREQPRLSATGSVVPYPSFADSKPIGHITDVEQTPGFGGKWRRFQEFESWRSVRIGWSW